MPVYKDEKRGTWWVSVRYTNWAGQPDRKVKRGFSRIMYNKLRKLKRA